MTVRQALQAIKKISIPEAYLPVEKTSAAELQKVLLDDAALTFSKSEKTGKGVFRIAVARAKASEMKKLIAQAPAGKHWAYLQLAQTGEGTLVVSHPALLFAYTTRLVEDWLETPQAIFASGHYFSASFKWHRPLFDYMLTQSWRTARNFDPESHIRELARAGYTHLEVNGLAMPVPFDLPVPGEYYSQFYSYCAALDQFVSSKLNRGIYPVEYLTANLNLLKKYAAIGRRYGLEPGILCFEPRSVPEKLFERYPTLRGARVDHPFRSRRPRYNLTIAHPLAQEHYTEMMQNLLQEVPELAYMSIWSNDSGAGFEYTSSLYVGRNGGPYLIREWRTHEQIAEVAGKNIVRFMRILREAAAKINPEFRITIRLEPFKVEHDTIIDNLEPYLDIEVPSLLVRGYDLPYHHDKYPDIVSVAQSIQHLHMDPAEKELIHVHKQGGITSHLTYCQGNGYSLEPLLGIPFPWMIHQKLAAMAASQVEYAANLGGFTPSSLAPYHINQEVFRVFMLNPEEDVDQVIHDCAVRWVGEAYASKLVEIWKNADATIRWLPILPLYSAFGFVWLRTWVRPIVPDLHAIPEEDRCYYEKFMVSTDNNPALVDLGRDVLFDLISQEYGQKFVERVDENVWNPLEAAIALATKMANDQKLEEKTRQVFVDQRDRLLALRCWIGTQRSTAAWVAGVYGYLETTDKGERKKWRAYLDEMVTKELQFARDLLSLWETSTVQFMAVSRTGETSYIYGENFGALVKRKIELMEKYRKVEPRIDKNIMWKVQ